jgi:hypothetical protein
MFLLTTRAGNLDSTALTGLSFAGITDFISSKDLQDVMDRMHSADDGKDATAAINKQENTGYTAHMLQDAHKDAANQ